MKQSVSRVNDNSTQPGELERALSLAASGLGILWLVIPATQYFATVQRTKLLAGDEAQFAGLAILDLTGPYFLLLAATLVFLAFRPLALKRLNR